FRTIHTIKGSAGFLGLPKLEALAHAGEGLLSLLRDGSFALTPDMTSALLSMVDGVRSMLKHVEASGSDGSESHAATIEQLGQLCKRKPRVEAPPPAIGQILVEKGHIGPAELAAALEQQKKDPRKIGEILVSRRSVRPHVVA